MGLYVTDPNGKLVKVAGGIGSSILIDANLDENSTNPVQNKVITQTVNTKADKSSLDELAQTVNTKADKSSLDELAQTVNTKADTSYVDQKVTDLVGAAPGTLDTLEELANALKNNANVVEVLENAISNKADKSQIESLSNPNLLINGDFQIRKTNVPEMWSIGSDGALTLDETGVTYTSTGISALSQIMEIPFEMLAKKTVTLSAKMNGIVYFASATIGSSKPTETSGETIYINLLVSENNIRGYLKFVWVNSSQKYRAYFYFSSAQTVKFDYIKLETGAVATTYSPNTVETYLSNNMPGNPNLLINGDFRINQRGQTSYSGTKIYAVDRWVMRTCIVDVLENGVKVTQNAQYFGLNQTLEDFNHLKGKTVTLSVKFSNVNMDDDDVYIGISNGNTPETRGTIIKTLAGIKEAGVYTITTTIPTILESKYFNICIQSHQGVSTTTNNFTVEYAKLEIGNIATAFSPRPYAEELAMCQRYYEKIDVSNPANKFNILKVAMSSVDFYDGGLVYFKTTKRTLPTIHCYSQNKTINKLTNATQSNSEFGVSYSYITYDSFRVKATNSSLTVNDFVVGYYEADAEMY